MDTNMNWHLGKPAEIQTTSESDSKGSPVPATIEWEDGVVNIENKIAGGTFGTVYRGKVMQTGQVVAVKFEDKKCPHPQLHQEKKLYHLLKLKDGFPRILWHGSLEFHNVMVMDLLGPSLEDLFNFCKRRFTLKTVLLIGCQAVNRLEAVHSKGFVHRDIKPDNFVMGINDSHRLYMIDFGLSKLYRDPKTRRHFSCYGGKHLIGTARYASIRAHMGYEHSRRDDLESLGYMLIYFYKGELPWQNISAETKKQKFDKILEIKNGISSVALCSGCPPEFQAYVNYCRSLEFTDEPNYKYLHNLFFNLFNRSGFQNDNQYDWVIRNQALRRRQPPIQAQPQPPVQIQAYQYQQLPRQAPAPLAPMTHPHQYHYHLPPPQQRQALPILHQPHQQQQPHNFF